MERERRAAARAQRVCALLAAAAVVHACARGGAEHQDAADAAPRPAHELRVTTAFGPFTQPLIQEYQRVLSGVTVKAVQADDSDAVVHALVSGQADFGLAYADAVYGAYATPGVRSASVLRGVSVLEPLPLYVFVRNDSSIGNIADLRGRRVAVPSALGISRWTLGQLLLRALGIDPVGVPTLSRNTILQGLADGSVDAVLLPGWTRPMDTIFPSIQPVAHVLPVQGPVIERLRAEYPFIRRVTVPRVLFEGQPHPVQTVGMDVLVVCRDDVPESVVYRATKHIFLAYPRLSGVEATLRFLNLDEAAATPIPLHPGAARYFRERELSR